MPHQAKSRGTAMISMVQLTQTTLNVRVPSLAVETKHFVCPIDFANRWTRHLYGLLVRFTHGVDTAQIFVYTVGAAQSRT
jgi:hypothetical protein